MLRAALIALLLGAPACDCGQDGGGPESPIVLTFGDRCGGTDGCDLDLSCLRAVSIRTWTATGVPQATCLQGDAIADLQRGCDLGQLDVALDLAVDDGPLAVELLGLSSDDCAPVEDAEATILFEGIASVASIGEPVAIELSCGAGCGADTDPCDGAGSCDCCAGVCVDDDAMLHCAGCFDVCDPFRSDRCDEHVCLCGTNPACGPDETCCPDGTCAPIGSCAPTDCPFTADADGCTNPATDDHDCGGGLDADSCSSTRADGCFAGGCTCGGGPSCGDPGICLEGRCVD